MTYRRLSAFATAAFVTATLAVAGFTPGAANAQSAGKKAAAPAANPQPDDGYEEGEIEVVDAQGAEAAPATKQAEPNAPAQAAASPAPATGGEMAAAPPAPQSAVSELGAASFEGAAGLLRTVDASRGGPWSLRLSLRGEVNRFDDTLFADGSANENLRLIGRLGLAFTFGKYVELYGAVNASANENTLSTPRLIQNLSQAVVGVKGGYDFLPYLSTSLAATVGLNGVPGKVGLEVAATSISPKFLISWDAWKTPKVRFPLKLHVNIGGRFYPGGAYDAYSFSPVEAYGFNLSGQAFLFGFGAEFPLKWVTPFIEFTLEEPRGLLVVTPGIRIHPFPTKSVALELACDIGLRRTIYVTNVAAVPPWNAIFGLNVAFDFSGKAGGGGAGAEGGTITGQVIDAQTGKPIGDAIISLRPQMDRAYASSPLTGRFETDVLPPGPFTVEVRREGYATERRDVLVVAGQAQLVAVNLAAGSAPAQGQLFVRVQGDDGRPRAAKVTATPKAGGAAAKPTDAATNPKTGDVDLALAPGSYTLTVTPEGGEAATREVALDAGSSATLYMVVGKPATKAAAAPAFSFRIGKASLNWGRITLSDALRFDDTGMSVAPESLTLLDDVVKLVKANPSIRKIVIEGHTDSEGKVADRVQRSLDRADRVRRALVAKGLPQSMFDVQGLGDSQPIASNRTASGRAQNNRVELRVSETAE
jgi:outer membrane protein OmpA-like peptidoglycan-associated protein